MVSPGVAYRVVVVVSPGAAVAAGVYPPSRRIALRLLLRKMRRYPYQSKVEEGEADTWTTAVRRFGMVTKALRES